MISCPASDCKFIVIDISGKPQKTLSKLKHHSDTVASKAKYNENVSKTLQLCFDVFIDPFKFADAPPGLVNFATASSETKHSPLEELDTVNTHVSKFINEKLSFLKETQHYLKLLWRFTEIEHQKHKKVLGFEAI